MGYIREFFYLYIPTHLYKQFIDYPNINQIVNNITKPRFEDCNFLILKARLIPKIIMFIDKINDSIALTTHFWSLLLLE